MYYSNLTQISKTSRSTRVAIILINCTFMWQLHMAIIMIPIQHNMAIKYIMIAQLLFNVIHWLSIGNDYMNKILYSRKVWQGECLANLLFWNVWQKKVWRVTGSAKGLLMVTTDLDGFSLVNHRWFAKFTKLSTRQTFPLYGIG